MSTRRTTYRHAGFALAFLALLVACGENSAPIPAVPEAAAIQLTPTSINVVVGADSQLVAVVTDGSGAVIANARVAWSSTDPSVAWVSDAGVLRGLAAGTATITAITGQHIATAKATVLAPPAGN
jgi:uncharacterized protein YjdB